MMIYVCLLSFPSNGSCCIVAVNVGLNRSDIFIAPKPIDSMCPNSICGFPVRLLCTEDFHTSWIMTFWKYCSAYCYHVTCVRSCSWIFNSDCVYLNMYSRLLFCCCGLGTGKALLYYVIVNYFIWLTWLKLFDVRLFWWQNYSY